MKKVKQIMAIIGILLLVALYVTTLVLALTDNPDTMNAFRASVYCTVTVPVLIWAYTFIYKLVHRDNGSIQDSIQDEHLAADTTSQNSHTNVKKTEE